MESARCVRYSHKADRTLGRCGTCLFAPGKSQKASRLPFCSSTGDFSFMPSAPGCIAPLGEVLLWPLRLLCFISSSGWMCFKNDICYGYTFRGRIVVFQRTKVLVPAPRYLPKRVGARGGTASHRIGELCEREPSKIALFAQIHFWLGFSLQPPPCLYPPTGRGWLTLGSVCEGGGPGVAVRQRWLEPEEKLLKKCFQKGVLRTVTRM